MKYCFIFEKIITFFVVVKKSETVLFLKKETQKTVDINVLRSSQMCAFDTFTQLTFILQHIL